MPLIMLDGVDGAGKTTFANELRDAWNGPSRILHRSQFTGNPMDEYENSLLDYYPASDELVILDRWFLSELVYGTVLRDRSKLTIRDTVHIDKFLASRGALNIVMTAPTDVLLNRLTARGEDYLPMDKVFQVNKMFVGWAKENDWIVLKAGSSVTPGEVVRAAVAHAKSTTLVGTPVSYVGPAQPSHILVMTDETTTTIAGQPEWTVANVLRHPIPVRAKRVGQVFLSEFNRDLWNRLSCPPVLADTDETADSLFKAGWELVDVY